MSIYAFLSIAIHGKVNIEDDLGRAYDKVAYSRRVGSEFTCRQANGQEAADCGRRCGSLNRTCPGYSNRSRPCVHAA